MINLVFLGILMILSGLYVIIKAFVDMFRKPIMSYHYTTISFIIGIFYMILGGMLITF